MHAMLAGLESDVSDAERIDRIRLLTELEASAAAARAAEITRFDASQRAEHAAAGVPAERVGRGIAHQVALAMRCSPARARKLVGWAKVLTTELPHTFDALRAGRITEWRATIVARETIWLSREDRMATDAEIAGSLESSGDRRVEAAVKTIAYRRDPQGFVARSRAAENDRRVTLRPAPDCMTRLTALLPVTQGVAAYAALNREADTAISMGDPRGRGQVMSDTLVERLTGQSSASAVPVEVHLVMPAESLVDPDGPGGNEPAVIDGLPIPAGRARELLAADAPAWLRRLFRAPHCGEVIAMESRRREFSPMQRRFLRLRDQICRTPWCDAPIRHTDHVVPVEQGGATTVDNGQGFCEACNYAKQAPGWRQVVSSRAGPHEVLTTTPTGHTYSSRAPDPTSTRAVA
jgi:hypothetical protein